MKLIFLTALAMVVIQAACGTGNRTPADPSPNRADRMKIRLNVEGTDLTATLIDSQTSRDFISLLPLTLTLNDLFGREKFAHLPRALSEGDDGPAPMRLGRWPIGLPTVTWPSTTAMTARRSPTPALS